MAFVECGSTVRVAHEGDLFGSEFIWLLLLRFCLYLGLSPYGEFENKIGLAGISFFFESKALFKFFCPYSAKGYYEVMRK